MEGYWNKFTQQRVSRRRALQAAAVTGVGAAGLTLVGCGGGSSDEPQGVTGDSSGLLSKKVDTSARAKPGGTWKSFREEDLISTNPLVNTQGAAQSELLWAYSTLTMHGKAIDRSVGSDEMIGDAAESWEINADATQITLKLRPGLKFDPRPPTNGRAVTAQDVKFAYEAAEKGSPYGTNVFNSRQPAAPITSIETPDDMTVVMKMAFPYGPIVEMIGHHQHPLVVPMEADGKFNADAEMRGSGPFILSEYQQSARMVYERNPGWHMKGRPFFDRVEKPIITDYAAGLAQFESKATWDYLVKPADILRVKRDHPEMVMLSEPRPSGYISQKMYNVSKQPDSVMKDVRLRRAFAMTLDRDLYIDAMFDTAQFEDEGLPVERAWNGHLIAFFPSWIDPKNEKEMGEGAKYFKYNPAEAKKLVNAAGFDKVKLPWGYYADRGTTHARANEIPAQMAAETGLFDVSLDPLPYSSGWRQVCQYSAGMDFGGLCYNSGDGFNEDAYLVNVYTPDGKFATSPVETPGFTDLVTKSRQELDPKRRSEIIKEVQRKAALEWHYIPIPGRALGFTIRWPWLMNDGVFQTGGNSARVFQDAWFDESKMTT